MKYFLVITIVSALIYQVELFNIFNEGFGIGIEKPSYQVLSKINDKIEIRKYTPSKWVQTSLIGDSSRMPSNMFKTLFMFISGSNEANQKIKMTAPVLTQMQSSSSFDTSTQVNFTMGFYVPKANQDNTPAPVSSDIFIKNVPETTYAIIRFGGYASLNDYIRNREILFKTLGSEISKYDTTSTFFAGYDSPFKFWFRTNEVWLKKL